MTPRNTKRQRLESAGFVHISGWLPLHKAKIAQDTINAHAAEAERIGETLKPSGRPRRGETK